MGLRGAQRGLWGPKTELLDAKIDPRPLRGSVAGTVQLGFYQNRWSKRFSRLLASSKLRITIQLSLCAGRDEFYAMNGADQQLDNQEFDQIDGWGVFWIFWTIRTQNCDLSSPMDSYKQDLCSDWSGSVD